MKMYYIIRKIESYNIRLFHGVMVARQFLALQVQVRSLMKQLLVSLLIHFVYIGRILTSRI